MAPHDCQDGQLRGASDHVSRGQVLLMRAIDQVQREGSLSLARRAAAFVSRRAAALGLTTPGAAVPAAAPPAIRLSLRKDDWVEVKSRTEIEQTLDGAGRTRGLRFMPGMFAHCGQRFRVYKRAETIVLEGTGETRRLKDTVLLTGSICDGEGFVCDRSCFYFWKEDWLKRA